MPIQLIPIAPDELAVFLERIRPQYVAERMQADHLSRVEAEQFVTTQWQRTLPNGTATPGHHFFWGSLDAASAQMGLLWVFLDAACRHAFINEIIVFDAFRRRG